jgi:hypothetical protein
MHKRQCAGMIIHFYSYNEEDYQIFHSDTECIYYFDSFFRNKGYGKISWSHYGTLFTIK